MDANTIIDWDQALETIDASNLPELSLERGVSEAFAPASPEDELDAIIFDAIDDGDVYPASPGVVSYASSDDSEARSIQNSCSSSDFDDEGSKKKKRAGRKRNTTGLSAQEKRELRKLRNRELAAESRKRKNDEMDRLRQENRELKTRVVELEKQLAQYQPIVTGTKRSRAGTAIGTSVAVASLALFVVTGPSEQGNGIGNAASVLLAALDSCDGQLVEFAKFVGTMFLAILLFCAMALLASHTAPFKMSSSFTRSLLPQSLLPRRTLSSTV